MKTKKGSIADKNGIKYKPTVSITKRIHCQKCGKEIYQGVTCSSCDTR